jgi:putative flippase GtrA
VNPQALRSRPQAWRVFRFLATGALNTAFGYGVYAALVWAGLDYLLALSLATVVGLVFNYFSYGRLVFQGSAGRDTFRKFAASYAATYAFNALLLHLVAGVGGMNPYLGQALCMAPTILLSWFLMSRWVFAK